MSTVGEIENKRYEQGFRGSFNEDEQTLTKILFLDQNGNPDNSKIRVLDVGAGSGAITELLDFYGYDVHAIDISSVAVQILQDKGIKKSKVCDVDEGLPYESNYFHALYLGDILEHVEDPVGLINECYRILKNNGRIYISVPSDVGIVNRIKTLFGISYQEDIIRKTGFYKHKTFFTKSLLRYLTRDFGEVFLDTTNSVKMPFKSSLWTKTILYVGEK